MSDYEFSKIVHKDILYKIDTSYTSKQLPDVLLGILNVIVDLCERTNNTEKSLDLFISTLEKKRRDFINCEK